MSQILNSKIAVIGIDIGKNTFHVVGHDQRGAIVLRQNGRVARWKRGLPTCRRASSAWRPAPGRIISAGSSSCSATMPG